MPDELRCVVSWAAQVTVQDGVISAASTQEGVVPRHSANAPVVPTHSFDQLIIFCVPNL